MVKEAINEHANHNNAELDRSRQIKKGSSTRRRFAEQVAVSMHTMGTSFVGKVRDVQQQRRRLERWWPTWWSSKLR